MLHCSPRSLPSKPLLHSSMGPVIQRTTYRGCSRVFSAALHLASGQGVADRISIDSSMAAKTNFFAPGRQELRQERLKDKRQEGSGAGTIGEDSSGQPAIEAGGGPRTYPGGVTKWQWKRMQEKKAGAIEKARLMREREIFEAQRREQLRMINGPERPWEETRVTLPSVIDLPRVPEQIVNRFENPKKAKDLWNENDGPTTFRRTDGQVSARFLPSKLVVNTHVSQRVEDGGFGMEIDNVTGTVPQSRKKGKHGAGANNGNGGKFHGADTVFAINGVDQSQQQRGTSKRSLESGEESQPIRMQNRRGSEQKGSGPAFVGASHASRKPQGSRGLAGMALNAKAGASRGRLGQDPPAELAEEFSALQAQETGGTTVEGQVAGSGGSGADPTFMSEVRFDSFPLNRCSIQALHQDLGYEVCTKVQAASMPAILSGRDVLAKAKTGTGKTIAFLLPALEALLQAESGRRKTFSAQHQGTPIRTLVICPARELATQVAEEAKILLKHHDGCGAQLVMGGTRMPGEAARLAKQPCQVLVGTPGRLLDHIQSTHGVKEQLRGVQTLILDECDQLLDMGFRQTLDGILSALPPNRQTLLFSATLPKEVAAMVKVALKPDHAFIDTVGEETHTNVQVRQEKAIVALEKQLPAVYTLLLQHMAEEPLFKVLVFATTARQTQLMAELFRALGVHSLEIHSRKSQSYRTKVSDQFRACPGGVVMFTSDVSARGVDYPDVTLVLQVGVPSEKAQYIHRLGRTGRAGKEGRGVLLLSPWESFFLRQLSDLPVEDCNMPVFSPQLEAKLNAALAKVEEDTKAKAYQAWLGYYNSVKGLKWDKRTLVEHANFYSEVLGLEQPPALMKKTIGMMGLRGVPGLRVM